MCRSRKPGLRFSASPLEKTDARQGESGFRDVPQGDSCSMNVRAVPRPVAVLISRFTVEIKRGVIAGRVTLPVVGSVADAALLR